MASLKGFQLCGIGLEEHFYFAFSVCLAHIQINNSMSCKLKASSKKGQDLFDRWRLDDVLVDIVDACVVRELRVGLVRCIG